MNKQYNNKNGLKITTSSENNRNFATKKEKVVMEKRKDIFISYSRRDLQQVIAIRDELM